MKIIRKIFVISLCGLLSVLCFTLNASALVFSEGDYGFELNTRTQKATVVEYNGTNTEIYIPGSYSTYPVTKVAASAFSKNSNIVKVSIPSSVTNVEDNAFDSCSSLTEISFPSSLKNVGANVCMNCTSLESVYFNAGISSIPQSAFAGCTSLENFSLSSTVTDISTYAFYYCTSLEDISFIAGVTTIGAYAFDHTGIRSVSIPEGVETLAPYSFSNCANLSRVDIPAAVNSIDETAFANDPNLTLGVWYDSYAFHFAQSKHIPYVLLNGVKLGDVDGDEDVTINDVTVIQRHLAELAFLEGIYLHAADANQDGTVDISDATAIQMYLAEYEIPYSINQAMTQ